MNFVTKIMNTQESQSSLGQCLPDYRTNDTTGRERKKKEGKPVAV